MLDMLLDWLISIAKVIYIPLMFVLLFIAWLLPGAIIAPIVWHGDFYKKDRLWLAFCPYFVTWLRGQLYHKNKK